MTTQRFNLLYEPCLPIVKKGRLPLLKLFEDKTISALSGTPLQKIALMKFLLAIAQAAKTPADLDEWLDLGSDGLAEKCHAYLMEHEDWFWLYGPRPFLQVPACERAKLKAYGVIMPEIASGNTTVLTQFQVEPDLDEADKFLLLLSQMSLCFGGKKPDKTIVLSPGYEKGGSAKPGPAVCHPGLLHSFLLGRTLLETLWLNLLTLKDIDGQRQWTAGLGIPPWELMPEGEACPAAESLKSSLLGRLIPLARFCLLKDEGLHLIDGIVHQDYKEGLIDPSAALNLSKSKPSPLWADPEKRPWRQLPALLSFLSTQSADGFHCLGLKKAIEKARDWAEPNLALGVWSGGVKLTINAGEQYLTGRDDMVESELRIAASSLGENWFAEFSGSIECLEKMAKRLYKAVKDYYSDLRNRADKDYAAEAEGSFWQMAEQMVQDLIIACDREHETWTEEVRPKLFKKYWALLLAAYDESCPHDTARQFETWVRHRPFAGRKDEQQ